MRQRSPFIHRGTALSQNGGHPMLLADSIDAVTPALIIGMPTSEGARRLEHGSPCCPIPKRSCASWSLSSTQNALRQQLVEPLVAEHFGSGASAEYVVTIVRRANPTQIVYSSDPRAPVDEKAADVALPVFTLRPRSLTGNPSRDLGPPRPQGAGVDHDRAAGDGLRRWLAHRDRRPTSAARGSCWSAGKAGSLEALVARSRRRNLAISLGVLGLLRRSFVLIIASAQRQRRLARQQMEFVAAVSHELRTPLAVICSAGENLADGVVADASRSGRYGALVRNRGPAAGRHGRARDGVCRHRVGHARAPTRRSIVAQVLADAVHGVSADARAARHCDAGASPAPLPCCVGDADALRSAVQNVVGNAVKYSAAGGTVDVDRRRRTTSRCQFRVADRGIGIDATICRTSSSRSSAAAAPSTRRSAAPASG